MKRDLDFEYSDAWREGHSDGLLKSIKVALRANAPEIAYTIANVGLYMFPRHFLRVLNQAGYQLEGRILVQKRPRQE